MASGGPGGPLHSDPSAIASSSSGASSSASSSTGAGPSTGLRSPRRLSQRHRSPHGRRATTTGADRVPASGAGSSARLVHLHGDVGSGSSPWPARADGRRATPVEPPSATDADSGGAAHAFLAPPFQPRPARIPIQAATDRPGAFAGDTREQRDMGDRAHPHSYPLTSSPHFSFSARARAGSTATVTPCDDASAVAGPSRLPPRAPRRRHATLDSIDTSSSTSSLFDDAGVPAGAAQDISSPQRTTNRDAYATSSRFSPIAAPADAGPHRRRLSNPHGPSRWRKSSGDDVETTPTYAGGIQGPPLPPSFNWLSGNLVLPPAETKHSKSDDERDSVDSPPERRAPPPPGRRKNHWAMWGAPVAPHHAHATMPSISMTPPNQAGAFQLPLGFDTGALAPLPQDPHNLLPLSAANSPSPSPSPTPYHSPRGSIGDLAAEYAASAAGALGSGHVSGSPRTSMSTSSSHFGWATGRTWSESSRSGEDDDGSSPTRAKRGAAAHGTASAWWSRAARGRQQQQPHASPVPSPISTAPRMRVSSAARLIPAGSRRWSWLAEAVHGAIGAQADRRKSAKLSRARQRKAGDRLHGGSRVYAPPVLGSQWLGRACALVPTTPKTILLFLCLFGCFALAMTLTIKHILNPDKAALPWREYCTAGYPTLYSLQDPYSPAPHLAHADFTSAPVHRSLALNSFSSSPANPVLTPLTPAHALWPYSPRHAPPLAHDLAGESLDADGVAPVGVLIGVMTTDAGVERRNMIRQSYATHWRSRRRGTEGVRVRFIMGRPRARYRAAVELEMEAFNDILLLDIPENMNSGKTHAFFSWAAANATVPDWTYDGDLEPRWRGEKRPDYVVKADEDSFIMLGELERRLRAAPRTKAYWGYLVKNLFMAGECYALSFDLVEYIAASPALRTLTRGKEDKLVSRWMRMHPERESIVWVAERCWIYDHPKAGTVYSHGFLFPAEVEHVRHEARTGLDPPTLAARGGRESAAAYSTVSKFGTRYRAPSPDLGAVERVEALVEGAPLSRLHRTAATPEHAAYAAADAAGRAALVRRLARDERPARRARFRGDPAERGGTVVVHYIKKQDWFVETMVALLGTADEQADDDDAGWAGGGAHGVSTGLSMLERRATRTPSATEQWGAGVRVAKDAGL